MSDLGGFICPFCRYYNPIDAKVCGRCDRRLPPPSLAGSVRTLMGVDLWATKALAAVSIVVFALQLAMGGPKAIGLVTGMPGAVILRFGGITNGLESTEPYRLLAACFIHFGILHVAMNMLSLGNLGRVVEPQIGGPRLIFGYVLTGIVGFAASVWWFGAKPYLTAGASGAVFGIEGILLGTLAVRRDPQWKAMLSNLVINSVVLALMMPVNNAAHVGGCVAGLVLGVVFQVESRPWKIGWLMNGLTIVCGVAIVGSLVLSQLSPTSQQVKRMQERSANHQVDPDDE